MKMESKQPNSRACFVCGVENTSGLAMKFFEISPGEVMAEHTVTGQFQSYPGMVHGGIIAAMLDEASGRSLMGSGESRFMYTAQLTIRYRKPVPLNQPLKILGHAGESRGHISKARGEIFGPDGQLLAQADAVLIDIPQETLKNMDEAAIGWKVYPDNEVSK
jgi:acyl-coenzyme A thioesterase PaaI-like protein